MNLSHLKNHKHIDRRLLIQLRLFMIISIVLLGVVGYDMVIGILSPWLALLGLLIGFGGGILAGRMLTIFWHEDDAKVVSRLDKTGLWILAVYIAFSVSRKYIAGIWIHGPALLAFTFATVAGVMAGRFIFMNLHVRKVLEAQKII